MISTFYSSIHTIIKRSIAYTQNYIAKYKKCFSILKKNFRTKSLAALGVFIAKWVLNDNSNADKQNSKNERRAVNLYSFCKNLIPFIISLSRETEKNTFFI